MNLYALVTNALYSFFLCSKLRRAVLHYKNVTVTPKLIKYVKHSSLLTAHKPFHKVSAFIR